MRRRKYVHSCKVVGAAKRRTTNTNTGGGNKDLDSQIVRALFDKYYKNQLFALYRATRT